MTTPWPETFQRATGRLGAVSTELLTLGLLSMAEEITTAMGEIRDCIDGIAAELGVTKEIR